MSEQPEELLFDRHYSPEEATEMLPALRALIEDLRRERDLLTEDEAREALVEASPTNGGGAPGKQVGAAFLEVRRLLGQLTTAGIVLRDIDRGLLDFPAIQEGREIFLCWEMGEAEVGYWHDLEGGFGRRQPLD